MKIKDGSKVLFIGDSITDCERARPVGEGLFGAEGKSYVGLIHAHLGAVCPERKIRVVNMGSSGNTVVDLKARWKTDVLDLRPDWVTIMIGVNDVWRQHDLPLQTETHVHLKPYRETLAELVKLTQPKVRGIILMTPFYIEPLRADSMRHMMDLYGAAVESVARKYRTEFVDTQAAMDAVLKHCHSNFLAWDRVHPNPIGHMVLARAWLRAMDCPM
ncbi:MAG: SGNH/GDSL hydrolase family protein [Verrucomicrobiae bacterium]|nr:SGNH/GDSL hydrolase family protein [Verrucomicrobiae bacterium]